MKKNYILSFVILLLLPSVSNALLVPIYDYTNNSRFAFTDSASSYDAVSDNYAIDVSMATTRLFNFGGPGTGVGVNGFDADLNAIIDSSGSLLSGTFSVRGGIASLGIASGSLLLDGTLASIETQYDESTKTFSTDFILDINYSSAGLGFDTGYAVWENHFLGTIPSDPTILDSSNVYMLDWGPRGAPLNSYINEVQVEVPEPASVLLLGIGLLTLLGSRKFISKPV